MDIHLDYLKYHPELVEMCARWSYQTWGHRTPEKDFNDYLKSRKNYLNDNSLPLTLIAFDGDIPVGMASLAETRGLLPGSSPWLATLYVEPDHRHHGVAQKLEAAICDKARQLGYTKIYCFMSEPETVSLAKKANWQYRCMDRIHNHDVTVMEKDV